MELVTVYIESGVRLMTRDEAEQWVKEGAIYYDKYGDCYILKGY